MQDLADVTRALERSGRAGAIRELAASADGQKLGGLVDAQAAERALKSGTPRLCARRSAVCSRPTRGSGWPKACGS